MKLNLDLTYYKDNTSIKEQLSKIMDGWTYEVYLKKEPFNDDSYISGSKSNGYGYDPSEKILSGKIKNGQYNYTHDIDIKSFLPDRGTENHDLFFYTRIVPPAGNKVYDTIVYEDQGKTKTLNFSSDKSLRAGAYNFILFNRAPIKDIDEDSANFSLHDGNTFYYTDSVKKIDISGNLFPVLKPKAHEGDSYSYRLWNNEESEKPISVYTIINGNKYNAEIGDYGRVVFRNISTQDLKDDSDHKYEIVVVHKDKYNNDVISKREFSYNVINENTVSNEDIEKAFSINIDNNALEREADFDKNDLLTRESTNEKTLLSHSKNHPRVLAFVSNKYVSHLDHDVTLKIDIELRDSLKGDLVWYDPSDNKIKKITNGEITIKAGTHFKDIRILQSIKDDNQLNYDEEVSGVNEYGATITDGTMSLKKQNITMKLKNSGGETLSTSKSYIAETDYDVRFNFDSPTFDFSKYVKSGSRDELINGDRTLFLNNTTSTYKIADGELGFWKSNVEFVNEGVDVTIYSGHSNFTAKKIVLSKGNNILRIDKDVYLKDLASNISNEDMNNHVANTLTFYFNSIGRTANLELQENANKSYKNLHILKSNYENNFYFYTRPYEGNGSFYLKDLRISEKNIFFYNTFEYPTKGIYKREVYIDNLIVDNNGDSSYLPKIDYTSYSSYYQQYYNNGDFKTFFKNSKLAVGEINYLPNATFENTVIGDENSTSPVIIKNVNNISFLNGTTFANSVEITAMDGTDATNNHYVIDTTIDKDFTLTDTTIKNGGTNKFTFGEHSNVGNHANFNVDNSELIFESGSEFHGKVKAGSGNNSITIKSGATFDGTIDMGDSISNIVIEQGAHLGPNFHIGETGTGNEQTSGKYDTLTIFDDLDFNNVDVRGIEQINIGTKARGEMINLDLAYSELANLMRGNSNTIKFWGDNDNNMTLHNEAGKTFAIAADQSGVSGQPYTRYEVTDTVAGTTLRFDVHNDINLHIQ